MNPEFERCLKSQKIKVFSRGKMLADKELKVAASDLEQAKPLLRIIIINGLLYNVITLY